MLYALTLLTWLFVVLAWPLANRPERLSPIAGWRFALLSSAALYLSLFSACALLRGTT